MTNLLAAAAFFLLLHRLVSGSALRGRLVERLGERLFDRLFALASAVGLLWLALAYAGATSPRLAGLLWTPPAIFRDGQLFLQLLASLLIVAGATTPNPGTFRQEAVADRTDVARGILRLTRHPFLWGIALFAAGHMLAVPSLRSLFVFGTLLIVALSGTLSIDAKREHALGAKWRAFAETTSNLPFAAILMGRQALPLGEIGWKRVAAALALLTLLALVHPVVTGTSALP